MNSFKDIAYQILKEAGKSLHSKEITKIALKREWLKTAGKTPEATMNAQLVVDINSKKDKSIIPSASCPKKHNRSNFLSIPAFIFKIPGKLTSPVSCKFILKAFAMNGLHKRSPAIKSTKVERVLVELLLILASEFLFLNLYDCKR